LLNNRYYLELSNNFIKCATTSNKNQLIMNENIYTPEEQKVIEMFLKTEFKDLDLEEWFSKDLQRLKDSGCFENINEPK